MVEVQCVACGAKYQAPHQRAACRYCGERRLQKTGQKPRKYQKESRESILARMPTEGRKLRLFREEEFGTQREFARAVRGPCKRGWRYRCSRQMVDQLEWQRCVPSFTIARRIYDMMAHRGYEPARLHPSYRLEPHLRDSKQKFHARGPGGRRDWRWKKRPNREEKEQWLRQFHEQGTTYWRADGYSAAYSGPHRREPGPRR